MAIPLSNLQKQIQAPNVSTGKASINIPQETYASYQNVLNTLKVVGHGIDTVQKAKQAWSLAEDQNVANAAYLEYMENMRALNDELSQTNGIETEKFEKEYRTTAEKHLKNLELSLGVIKNGSVRENLKSQVNSFNINNQHSANDYFYKQREVVNEQRFVGAEDKKIERYQQNYNVSNPSLNKQNWEALKLQITSDRIAFDAVRGIPKEYTMIDVRKKLGQTAEQTVKNMIASAEDAGDFKLLSNVLNFIDDTKGAISEELRFKLYHDTEKEQLTHEVLVRSQELIKDGKLDRKLIWSKTPHLTPTERELIVRGVEESSQTNTLDTAKLDIDYTLSVDSYARDWFNNHGYMSDADMKQVTQYMSDEDKKKFKNIQETLRKNQDPSILLDQAEALNRILNYGSDILIGVDGRPIVGSDGLPVTTENATDEQKQFAVSIAHANVTSEAKKRLKEQIQMLQDNVVHYSNFSNLEPGLFYGKNPTVEQVMDLSLIGVARDAYTNKRWYNKSVFSFVFGKGETQPFMTQPLLDARAEFKRLLQTSNGNTGITYTDRNGKQQRLTRNTNFDALPDSVKEQVFQLLSESVATATPRSYMGEDTNIGTFKNAYEDYNTDSVVRDFTKGRPLSMLMLSTGQPLGAVSNQAFWTIYHRVKMRP